MDKECEIQECGPTYEMDVFTKDQKEYLLTTSKDQPVHMRECD